MKFSFSFISLFISFFIFLYVRLFYFFIGILISNLCLVNPGACFNNYPFPPGISIFLYRTVYNCFQSNPLQ